MVMQTCLSVTLCIHCLSCLLLREIFVWISPSAGSGYSSVFYGVFISEEVNGVAHKGPVDTTMVNVQTILLSFFEHVSEGCLFY